MGRALIVAAPAIVLAILYVVTGSRGFNGLLLLGLILAAALIATAVGRAWLAQERRDYIAHRRAVHDLDRR
jgi:hypothetical protein